MNTHLSSEVQTEVDDALQAMKDDPQLDFVELRDGYITRVNGKMYQEMILEEDCLPIPLPSETEYMLFL